MTGASAAPGDDGKPEQRKRKAGVSERSGSVVGLTGKRFLQPSRSDTQSEPQVPEVRDARRDGGSGGAGSGTKKRSARTSGSGSKALAEVTETNERETPVVLQPQKTLPLEGSIGEEKLPSEVDEARKALAESVKAIHEWYQKEMETMMSESDSDYDDSNYGYWRDNVAGANMFFLFPQIRWWHLEINKFCEKLLRKNLFIVLRATGRFHKGRSSAKAISCTWQEKRHVFIFTINTTMIEPNVGLWPMLNCGCGKCGKKVDVQSSRIFIPEKRTFGSCFWNHSTKNFEIVFFSG